MCSDNSGLFSKCRNLKKPKRFSTHGSSATLLMFNLFRMRKFTKFSVLNFLSYGAVDGR